MSVRRVIEFSADMLLGALPATCLLPMAVLGLLIGGRGKSSDILFSIVFSLLCLAGILGAVGLWIAAFTPPVRFAIDRKRRIWISSMMIMGIVSLGSFDFLEWRMHPHDFFLLPFSASIVLVAVKHIVMMCKYENAANQAL